VIKALLDSGDIKLDGIICPGHVSCIIGSHPYEFIPINYGIPSVIAGFEALDILLAVKMMIDQIEKGQPKVEIAYRRGVKPDGNIHALKIMNDVFDTAEVEWRGMGLIKGSGLKLKDEYKQFCAETVFSFEAKPASMPEECLCGEILRGIKTPGECKLFARGCTPDNPVGPCMVSSEGTCAAHFLYGYDDGR
jgi:hydrogenase expression/formation protein HypD